MDELHIFGASGAVGSFLLARLRVEQRCAMAYSHRVSLPSDHHDDPLRWRQLDLWRDADPSHATTIISAGPLDACAAWLARVDTPMLRRIVALSSMSIEAKRDAADAAERDVAERLLGAEHSLRQTCAERGIAWTLLRPTLIWGAAQDRSLTPLFRFGRRFGFVPVPSVAGGSRQPIHAADVADACLSTLHGSICASRIIPLGGAERLSVADMWIRVARAATARPLRMPIGLMRAGGGLLGTRGRALRAVLQRWHNDQVAESNLAELLPEWRPRGFAPVATDFSRHD